MTIRIIVADDHPIFRDGLVHSLEETGEFEVVGTGSTAAEAVSLASRERPDIALLDLSMPGGGLDAVREICRAKSARFVAMLTVSEDDAHVSEALRLGATGYILKGVSAAELRRVLGGIAAGEPHVSPGLAARVLTMMSRPPVRPERPAIDDLTRREEDILKLVSQGLSNKEVARTLDLQEKTIKHYMTAILSKLHARNRVEAAIIAHNAWGSDPE